jgi:hypothetical protein
MKTAIEQLIEFLNQNRDAECLHLVVLSKAMMLLKEEKKQIKEAWCNGNDNEPKETTMFYAEDYFNETYK